MEPGFGIELLPNDALPKASIDQKMLKGGDEECDRIAFRKLPETLPNCVWLLGLMHPHNAMAIPKDFQNNALSVGRSASEWRACDGHERSRLEPRWLQITLSNCALALDSGAPEWCIADTNRSRMVLRQL